MIEKALRVFAALTAAKVCPACESVLPEPVDGGHACKCGVIVCRERMGWRFAGEVGFRPLPGRAGLLYRDEAA